MARRITEAGFQKRLAICREINHPCQLPLVLLEKILKISSRPGDWVGDVFSGSGGTMLACRRLGRNVIGFEKNKEYEEIIKQKAKFGEKIIPRSENEAKKRHLIRLLIIELHTLSH
jgi:DNA modification methylase